MVTRVYLNVVQLQSLGSSPLQPNKTFPREVPRIPALPATLLQLDLISRQRTVDLRSVQQAIMADVGATLEVFRLAAKEFGLEDSRPERIAECVCALGVDYCADAIGRSCLAPGDAHTEVVAFWEHSKNIAQYCRMIAENGWDVDADRAYLVGLLHGIGALPSVLGWKGAGTLTENAAALRLAHCCALPHCAMQYFQDLQKPGEASVWTDLVRRAHGAIASRAGAPAGVLNDSGQHAGSIEQNGAEPA